MKVITFKNGSVFNIPHHHTNTATTSDPASACLSRFGQQYPDKTEYIPARTDDRVFAAFQIPQTKAREYQVSDTVLYHRDVGLRKLLTPQCLVTKQFFPVIPGCERLPGSYHYKIVRVPFCW